MPTPVARSLINVRQGINPDDLNQLLGTHAPVVVYAPSGGETPPIAPTTPPSFSQFFPLSDAAGSYGIDQTIIWATTPTNAIDRMVLPVSIAAGLGNDLMVGLYADSAGNAIGPPLAATFVPREFLQPSPCADFNGVMLSPWQAGAPNTTLPANLAQLDGQAFIDDGATNIFSIGGWDLTTPSTFVVSAPFAGNGIGAWQQTAPLPKGLVASGAAFSSGTIIVVGGLTAIGAASTGVYTAQASATGTVAAWTAQTALPVALWNASVVVVGNSTVYVICGKTSAGASVRTVYAATITDNTIGAWSTPTASQFPIATDSITVVQINGWLVALGEPGVTTVYAARINPATNTIGSWVPWPTGTDAGGATSPNAWVVDNNIVVMNNDGTSGSLAVNNSGPANAWVTQPHLPSPPALAYQNLTVVNNTLIAVGSGSGSGGTAQVYSVPTISVPLHATGLVNGTHYHIAVQQTDAYSQVNVTQIALTQVKPSTAYSLAQYGLLSSGTLLNPISADLLSGVSWNTNSLNCAVLDPVVQHPGAYLVQAMANGGAYSFSTPVGTAGIALAAGTSFTYAFTPQILSGAPQVVTASVFYYNSAGATISQSTIITGSTSGGLITYTSTAPATTVYASITITVSGGGVGDATEFTYTRFTSSAASYVPLSLYISGKTLKPMHVLDDIVNTQPSGWSTIGYDYAGKPVQYGECVLPIINLLSPNTSNFGGLPTGGTTAGWPTPVNCALSLWGITTVLPLSIDNSSLSAIGAPTLPSPNPLLQALTMKLTSAASGDMTVATATGTSGVPVVAGRSYTAFAYLKSLVSARNCSVTIDWYTASGGGVGHAFDTGSIVADNASYWTQAYVNAVAPATAAFARILLTVYGTGAANEQHLTTLVSLALDNSLVSGLATPNLAYFDPQSGPGGERTFLQLVYDTTPVTGLPMGTSQLTGVIDISGPAVPIVGVGTAADSTILATYTATGMTDTNAKWPMNGLVGMTISVQAASGSIGNANMTTAVVLFNIGTSIVLTATGWSNGQPNDGSQYSIA